MVSMMDRFYAASSAICLAASRFVWVEVTTYRQLSAVLQFNGHNWSIVLKNSDFQFSADFRGA